MLVFSLKVPAILCTAAITLLLLGAGIHQSAVSVAGFVTMALAIITVAPIPLPKRVEAAIRNNFGDGY